MGAICAWLVLTSSSEGMAKAPRLTVFITVDALGSDLLLRSRPQLKNGLAHLMSEGAYYPTARYDYARVETAPGMSTLATGANPSRHGIVGNRIVNRATGKVVPIFADPDHPVLEAPPSADDVSPRHMLAETLSDRLRLATQGRGKSVAIASKARVAIAMAGRLGQAWWFNGSVGKFVTGTFYAKEFPSWLKAFNDRQLPQSYFSKQWTLLLPPKAYVGEDDRPYEQDFNALGRAFPHPLNAGLSSPGPESYEVLDRTPYMNDVVVELAKAAIQGEGLGKDDIPDLLSISFASTDYIFHSFGPYSWEMQDAMIRLDKNIGELIAAAEKAAGGKKNLLVVLTADHGGAAIPEEWAAAGMPGVRVNPVTLEHGLAKELLARFGADLVLGIEKIDVYLNNKVIADARLDGAAVRRAAVQWLANQPDVAVAIARDDLFGCSDSSRWLDVFRRGYHPERSGDVLFLLRSFAVLEEKPPNRAHGEEYTKEATEHGTPYAYDSEVPVIFAGKGIRRGIYRQRISPLDVTPSIASLLEIGNPAMVEGVARAEALVTSD